MKKYIPFIFLFLCLSLFLMYPGHTRPEKQLLGHPADLPLYLLEYTPHIAAENTTPLPQKDTGFYHIYGYTLTREPQYSSSEEVPVYMDPTENLVLLQINLSSFPSSPLSQGALWDLECILSAYRHPSCRLILRFLYDWDGNALQQEPEDLGIILTHMEQTAGIYNSFAESIYLIQGLFIGNYGEMNGSRFSDTRQLVSLYETLNRVTDEAIFLAVRTPTQWRTLQDNVEDGVSLDRLGLFNDGMLGSETDLGTYEPGSRQQELDFQDTLCTKVPNGGEVVLDNPYNDLYPAIASFYRMHVSYLGSSYDQNVLSKWENTPYLKEDIYQGISGYDYISLHLGYRYVLRQSYLQTNTFRTALIGVPVDNVGFSSCYEPLDFTVTFLSPEGGVISAPLPGYSKDDLTGGKETILSVPFSPKDLPAGTYLAYLRISKAKTGELIPFAVDASPGEYGYLFGQFTLHKRLHTVPRQTPSSRTF